MTPKSQLQYFLDIGLFLTITGLFFSRIALSFGMVLLLANAIVFRLKQKSINYLWIDTPFLFYAALYFLYLSTGLHSENKFFFWERMRISLPLLILPCSFSVPLFSKPEIPHKWLLLYFVFVLVTAVHSTVDMFCIYHPFNSFTGMRVTTPINHVRYSLMVVFAVFVGQWLHNNYQFRRRWQKLAIVTATLFLLLYLHILSVRSGILGFYVAVVFIGFRSFIIDKKRRTVWGVALTLILCLGMLFLLPSAYYKLRVTYDTAISLARGCEITYASDYGRIKSIEAGLFLGKYNLWTGVGIGDVKQEIVGYYQKYYPELVPKAFLPHNQFVFVLAGTGLLGCLFFFFVIIYPIMYHRLWRYKLAIGFNIVMLVSFLFDHTLETQIGIGFYLFFQGFIIQVVRLQQ